MLSYMVEEKAQDSISCKIEGLGEFNRLKIPVESTELAVMKVLADGCGHLDELHRVLLQSVELYRAGDSSKGLGLFMKLIEGLEWFVKTAATAEQLLKLDFAGTSCSGQTLSESLETLNAILLEIIVAQERRDWVLLTDLLEYELAPQLEQWIEIFTMLQHRDSDFIGECLRS